MKKKIISVITALSVLSLIGSSCTFAENADDIKVIYDGTLLNFDVSPEILNDSVMVPMRNIFETFGAKVKWDSASQTVTAKKKSKTIVLTIGGNEITKNDESISIDTAPVIEDGRTLVPLRAVSETLGLNVEWDEESRTVTITTPEDDDDDSWQENIGTVDLSSLTASGDGISIDNGVVSITKGGDFEVTGSISDGMISVDTEEKVRLRLNNVSITNNDGAAIYFKNVDKGYIALESGTVNTVTDGSEYSEDVNGCIASEDNLEIKGSGSLEVNANYKHGIDSSDSLEIEAGNITINSEKDGIHVNDTLEISGGEINITAKGDGMQADEILDISGGDINITTVGEVTASQDEFGGMGGGRPGGMGNTGDFPGRPDFQDSNAPQMPDGEQGNPLQMPDGEQGNPPQMPDGEQGNPPQMPENNMKNIAENEGTETEMNSPSTDGSEQGTAAVQTEESSEESSKGIKADWMLEISGGTVNINSTDHSIHCASELNIEGGTLDINSSVKKGISAHGNISITDGTININANGEGLESKQILTIDGGDIHITAGDDGINTGGGNTMMRPGMNRENDEESNEHHVQINGGYVYIDANGDGIDSNGSITMDGGTVIVNGPESGGDSALDMDGACRINGGTLIAAGSSGMIENPSSSSMQNILSIYFDEAMESGTVVSIRDNEGNSVISFVPEKRFQHIMFSSEEIESGKTYKVYAGGECTGELKDGVYSGESSGGTECGEVTVSEVLSQIGTSNRMNGGGMGGGRRENGLTDTQ